MNRLLKHVTAGLLAVVLVLGVSGLAAAAPKHRVWNPAPQTVSWARGKGSVLMSMLTEQHKYAITLDRYYKKLIQSKGAQQTQFEQVLYQLATKEQTQDTAFLVYAKSHGNHSAYVQSPNHDFVIVWVHYVQEVDKSAGYILSSFKQNSSKKIIEQFGLYEKWRNAADKLWNTVILQLIKAANA